MPTLVVNGRRSLANVPYDLLKKIIALPGQARRRHPITASKGPEFLAPIGVEVPGLFRLLRWLYFAAFIGA